MYTKTHTQNNLYFCILKLFKIKLAICNIENSEVNFELCSHCHYWSIKKHFFVIMTAENGSTRLPFLVPQ